MEVEPSRGERLSPAPAPRCRARSPGFGCIPCPGRAREEEQSMRRAIVTTVMVLMVAVLGAGIAQAQQQAPPSQGPTLPPGTVAPPPEVVKEKQVEGTVSKVDPMAKTLGVSTGFFGLLGATVRVADDTQIRVQGQLATLADIKKGDRVKASYEVRA